MRAGGPPCRAHSLQRVADCDAQILVTHDLVGFSFSPTRPRFVRQYVDLRAQMTEAVTRYAEDVRTGAYPAEGESYPLPKEAAAELAAGEAAAGDQPSALSDQSKC